MLVFIYLILLAGSFVHGAIDPIVIKGSKFFYQTNGSEFYVKGVAYQDNGHFASSSASFIDPFEDGPTCARDIEYLLQVGVNVVRAYAVDPTADHSACMQLLQDAGIYVLTDMSGARTEVITATAPIWNYALYDRYTSVVDAFQNYTNVLGFFAGNEVANTSETTVAMAFVKAAVRDVKAYMKKKNYRNIPVGYGTTDGSLVRIPSVEYLNCGDKADTVDFVGFNNFAWCGDSTLQESGWSQLISQYRNFSVPSFLSEYGCTLPSPRNFTEVQALYGSQMTNVFSGGIVYQYYADSYDFGLVTVIGDSVTKAADFTALSSQIAKISPTSSQETSYTPTNTLQQSCPSLGSTWSASPTLPPVPYARLCSCMMESLSCVLNGTVSGASDSLTSICGGSSSDLCLGASNNGTTATYGAYSVCNSTEQISWIYNQYYLSQNNATSSCSKIGGTIQEPVKSLDSDCKILLRQAGAAGTGTITSTPAIPASATSSQTGSNSNGNSGSNSSGLNGGNGGVSNGGLSTGAKAGIGIGIAAVVIIIAVLGFFLWRSRRKNKAVKSETTESGAGEAHFKPELPNNEVAPHPDNEQKDAHELEQNAPAMYEMPGANTPSVNRDPAELEAPHGRSEVMQHT